MLIKLISHFVLIIWRFLLPLILLYYGRSPDALDKLKLKIPLLENIDKDYVFFAGVFVSFVSIPISLYSKEIKLKKSIDALSSFIGYNKDILVELLRKDFRSSKANFNIRIFKKQTWYKHPINTIFYRKKYFEMINVKRLGVDDEIKKLEFKVFPKNESQGLVGLSYNEGTMFYDFNVSDNLENNDYRLNKVQIDKTDNIKFVLTVPLFNNKEKVIGIISIDSQDEIKEPKNMNNPKLYFRKFCKKIHEHMNIITEELN